MFGYLIPRNYMEAMQFDSENKNSKWYDAIKLEMESMLEYKAFKECDKAILDKHKKVMNPPRGCNSDRIPSTTPGAEPPRDARDSGSARSHSTHQETSSPDQPKMVTYMEPKTVSSYMSVTFT